MRSMSGPVGIGKSAALLTWFLETDFEPRVGKGFSVRGPYIDRVNCVVVALEPPPLGCRPDPRRSSTLGSLQRRTRRT